VKLADARRDRERHQHVAEPIALTETALEDDVRRPEA
jgi:hypothetical protein